MDCWPLELLDKGKMGTLEDGDRVRVKEVKTEKGKEKCVVASTAKPRDYFSANSGDKSPIDRLKELVEAEPKVRTVNPQLLKYIFDQQREWYRNMAGH